MFSHLKYISHLPGFDTGLFVGGGEGGGGGGCIIDVVSMARPFT